MFFKKNTLSKRLNQIKNSNKKPVLIKGQIFWLDPKEIELAKNLKK